MASRSRLGKGLGALFPDIPGDDEQQDTQASSHAGNDAASVQAATAEQGSDSRHAVGDVVPSKPKQVKQKAQDGVRHGTAAKRTSNHAASRKRASVPSLGDLTHPSDMFFGADSAGTPSVIDDIIVGGHTENYGAGHGVRKSDPADVSRETSDRLVEPVVPNSGTAAEAKADQAGKEDDLRPVAGGYLAELQVTDIRPNAHQPRTIFDEDELLELSESIKEVGVLQPIVVRRRPADQQRDVSRETSKLQSQSSQAPYEIIMGERRWRASQMAGLATIPAIVKTTADDDMLRDALLENLHRVALNPLEEAAAYQQMIKEFGLTQQQLSQSVSKSRPQIANTLRLLQLPPSVQKKVASGVLSAGHARALLALNSVEDMDKLALRIIGEGLSVRSTEEIVAMMTTHDKEKTKAPAKRRANVWEGSAIQQGLENRFETKVAITGTKKHGRIEITFSSPEDMDRILSLLNPSNADASDGWV